MNSTFTKLLRAVFSLEGTGKLSMVEWAMVYATIYSIGTFTWWSHLFPGGYVYEAPITIAYVAIFILIRKGKYFKSLKSVKPLLIFFSVFFLWTLAVCPPVYQLLPYFGEQIRQIIPAVLTTVFCLAEGNRLRTYSIGIQVSAIFSAWISVRQTSNPSLYQHLQEVTNHVASIQELAIRPSALWENPNFAGIHFVFALIFSFWCPPSWAWAGRIAAVIGLVLSASRGAFFGIGIFFAVYTIGLAWYAFRAKNMDIRTLTTVVFVAVVGGAMVTNFSEIIPLLVNLAPGAGNSSERIGHLLNSNELQGTGERVWLFFTWLNIALHAPIQGYGYITSQGPHYSLQNIGYKLGPHNQFIGVWVDGGILMLALFVWTLFRGIVIAGKSKVDSKDRVIAYATWAVWISFLLKGHNYFDSGPNLVLWSIMFLIAPALELKARASYSSEINKVEPLEFAVASPSGVAL
jgi:O-Antigen ligase